MVFSISVFVDRKIREHQSSSRLIILTTILIILTDNLDNPLREIILTLFVSQNDIICSIPIERSYESDNKITAKYIAMVVMVTCKYCGHEYKSEVLQTPDEETLRSEPQKDIMENCPKCNQISSYSGPDFYWK